MNLSRRLFLGGVATAVAVKPSTGRAAVPILYGNMIHDDAPALNAWLRGDPIKVLDDDLRLHGEGYRIDGANLLIGSTVVAEHIPIALSGARITAMDCLEGPMLSVRGESHRITHLELISGKNTTYALEGLGCSNLNVGSLYIDMSRANSPPGGLRWGA